MSGSPDSISGEILPVESLDLPEAAVLPVESNLLEEAALPIESDVHEESDLFNEPMEVCEDNSRPSTVESESAFELEMIESQRQMNECLEKIEKIKRHVADVKDDWYYKKMRRVNYKPLIDIHNGKSKPHVRLVERLQDAERQGKELILPVEEAGDGIKNLQAVMLIGPPNLNLSDLRRYIAEDMNRFGTALMHTTRYQQVDEEQGVDYIFTSKGQFRSDFANRVYLEFGLFQGYAFGTTLPTIKEVVDSGKICVLKVRRLTLRVLRLKDLSKFKTFVAFIEPEKNELQVEHDSDEFPEEESL